MDEKMTPMDRVFDVLFFKWWGALLGSLPLFLLAWSIWPAPPKDPDNKRAFKANVQQFLLAAASGLCGVGMIVVAGYNLFGKNEPPKGVDGDAPGGERMG